MTNQTEATFTEEQLLLAFRYVAAELPTDEAEEFEQQMLTQQSLCEAVVQASSLSSLIASSTPQLTVQHPKVQLDVAAKTSVVKSSRKSRSLLMTVISACLCVLMLSAINRTDKGPASAVSQTSENDDAELLMSVWANEGEESVEPSLDESELLSDELDVPDWLLAAVTISSSEYFADEGAEL